MCSDISKANYFTAKKDHSTYLCSSIPSMSYTLICLGDSTIAFEFSWILLDLWLQEYSSMGKGLWNTQNSHGFNKITETKVLF